MCCRCNAAVVPTLVVQNPKWFRDEADTSNTNMTGSWDNHWERQVRKSSTTNISIKMLWYFCDTLVCFCVSYSIRFALSRAHNSTKAKQSPLIQLHYQTKHFNWIDLNLDLDLHQISLTHNSNLNMPYFSRTMHCSLRDSWKCRSFIQIHTESYYNIILDPIFHPGFMEIC